MVTMVKLDEYPSQHRHRLWLLISKERQGDESSGV